MNIIHAMLVVALVASGCRAVVADQPAKPRTTIIPDSPGPTYVWVGDSWTWDNQTRVYVLQEGRRAQPKKSRAVWVDGYWKQTRGGWKYIRGYWKHK